MAKRKTVEQQIAEAQKKIEQEQSALKKLQGKQKEQRDKARNHRLCKRHGLIESILPDTIELTDKQFEDFVRHHIANTHGRNKLAELVAQGEKDIPPPKPAEPTTQGVTDTPPKAAQQTGQPTNPTPQKSAGAEQNPKPNAPAGEKNNNGNPPKNNPNNAGTNSPTQGTPQGKPA